MGNTRSTTTTSLLTTTATKKDDSRNGTTTATTPSSILVGGGLLIPPQFGTGCDVHCPPPSRSSSHRSQTAAALLHSNTDTANNNNNNDNNNDTNTNNNERRRREYNKAPVLIDDPFPPYVVSTTTTTNHNTTTTPTTSDGSTASESSSASSSPLHFYHVVEEWIRRPNAGCAPSMALLSAEHLVPGLWISACTDPYLDAGVMAHESGADLAGSTGGTGVGGIRGSKLFFSGRGRQQRRRRRRGGGGGGSKGSDDDDANDVEGLVRRRRQRKNGKEDDDDDKVLTGGLDLSIAVPVTFRPTPTSASSSLSRTGGSIFLTRHLLPPDTTTTTNNVSSRRMFTTVGSRNSIFATMQNDETSSCNDSHIGSSATGGDNGGGNIDTSSPSNVNRRNSSNMNYGTGIGNGLATTTYSLARFGWNFGTTVYLPSQSTTTKDHRDSATNTNNSHNGNHNIINNDNNKHKSNNDEEDDNYRYTKINPINIQLGSSARYFKEEETSNRHRPSHMRQRIRKREVAGLSSHCCMTAPSRGFTAAVELDVPLTTTTISNNGYSTSINNTSSGSLSSMFAQHPATVGNTATDPYAPPESPPLRALLQDYWSGTGTLLPPEGLLRKGGRELRSSFINNRPMSPLMYGPGGGVSTRPKLDWPVCSYALSFDLNQLGGGGTSGDSDDIDYEQPSSSSSSRQRSLHPLPPPPIILTICKISSPKHCSTSNPNSTTNSTTRSITVSQNLAHRRSVTNPLEHRNGASDILNTVSWAVQLSRRSSHYGYGCDDNDGGNASRYQRASSSFSAPDNDIGTTLQSVSPSSPVVATSLTAALAWQVNSGLCYKLRADTDDGVSLGIILKRWTHPRVTCSLLFGSGASSGIGGGGTLVGFKGLNVQVETGPVIPTRRRRRRRISNNATTDSGSSCNENVYEARSFLYNPGVYSNGLGNLGGYRIFDDDDDTNL